MTTPWTHETAVVNGFRMHYVIAGSGYPLVFLHGWPQTWFEWRKIIPPLAEHFTVLAPDLRGLGDSQRPLIGYDKRTLASDVYELTRLLGFKHIGLTGHDWGGLVAYFLAYDHPEVVERLMILDMIPGLARKGEKIDLNFARFAWHVFFHAGMPDLAERLVSGNVETYLRHFYSQLSYNPALFTSEEVAEFVRAYSQPGALRAGFQYYRAGLDEDVEEMSTCTKKLSMPVLAWGGEAVLGAVDTVWKTVADNVQGGVVERCGHFIAEEQPEFVVQQAREFFGPLRK
jgi:pimeloyl-ACP methyl ester carboxylesterase